VSDLAASLVSLEVVKGRGCRTLMGTCCHGPSPDDLSTSGVRADGDVDWGTRGVEAAWESAWSKGLTPAGDKFGLSVTVGALGVSRLFLLRTEGVTGPGLLWDSFPLELRFFGGIDRSNVKRRNCAVATFREGVTATVNLIICPS